MAAAPRGLSQATGTLAVALPLAAAWALATRDAQDLPPAAHVLRLDHV
jgi:hypothetical protein